MAVKERFEEATWQVSLSGGGSPIIFSSLLFGSVRGNSRNGCCFAVMPVDTTDPLECCKQQNLVLLARMGKVGGGTQSHCRKCGQSERFERWVWVSYLQKWLPDWRGIIYFSNIQQIFIKCLSVPGAILGIGSRFLYHIFHRRPVVLVTWSMAGRSQGSQAAIATVW